jgi:hypothetical protein
LGTRIYRMAIRIYARSELNHIVRGGVTQKPHLY